ncbi:MAG TPA: class I SAM-dependent rRNA methyltransferase, partial [Thermoanaerobaculia bacterium]|nr:class I SAM-dependent rRNA methyltransferase [Thermoanaerobaculia bacterium]
MSVFTERRLITLKPGREGAVKNRHPWIFAGAIGRESGPDDAPLADLLDASGTRIASGLHSRHSQIRLRVLTWGDEELTESLFRARIAAAIARRRSILDEATNAARVINAEGDELSGLVVDRYNDLVVVEIANAGLDQLAPIVVDELQRALAPRAIYFKNDLPARKLERLTLESRPITASADIVESGLRFRVDPSEGQKTGFFLDQRENRRLARSLASGRRTLNLFSYTGAFGVYAAAGGATSVENVDVSSRAIELARENYALNAFDAHFTVADAFSWVRQTRERFDLIVCDPPAFAKSRGDVDRAARGYKDVNLHALKLLAPGGMLMT